MFTVSRCKQNCILYFCILQIQTLLWSTCLLCCEYAGSSLEVKIETDSNDAMEIKTDADSSGMFESPRCDKPTSGMFRVCCV